MRSFEQLKSTAEEFAAHLEGNTTQLLEILTRHESREAALDELERAIATLRNLSAEQEHLACASLRSTATFLPVNLPLYSLVLFAAVPAMASHRVFARVPAVAARWVLDVADAMRLRDFYPGVALVDLNRTEFVEHFASQTEAIIFTGRYENALEVRTSCDPDLFIFNGAGVNPIVLGPGTNLDADLDRILEPRIFNSGQDCAGPDAYLVHESIADDFVSRTASWLASLTTGDYSEPATRVGTIANRGPLPALAERLERLAPHVVAGGAIDQDRAIVEPTLIVRSIIEHDRLHEFFAPIIYVLRYASTSELETFFDRTEYQDYAMYASLFGEVPDIKALTRSSTILRGATVLEVEQGNTAYGGNGPKANFVRSGEVKVVGPVLVSQSMASHTKRRDALSE